MGLDLALHRLGAVVGRGGNELLGHLRFVLADEIPESHPHGDEENLRTTDRSATAKAGALNPVESRLARVQLHVAPAGVHDTEVLMFLREVREDRSETPEHLADRDRFGREFLLGWRGNPTRGGGWTSSYLCLQAAPD